MTNLAGFLVKRFILYSFLFFCLLSGCNSPETVSLQELESKVLTDSLRLKVKARALDTNIILSINNQEYMDVYLNGSKNRPDYRVNFTSQDEYYRVLNNNYYPYEKYIVSGNTSAVDLFIVISLIVFVLHIFLIFDVLRSNFHYPINKIAWLITLLLLPVVGLLLYIMLGRSQRAT